MKEKSISKKMKVGEAHAMMQLLNHLAQQTSGNPKLYGKPIAKTMRNVDNMLNKVTSEVRDSHVKDDIHDEYFQVAAQLDTVNMDRLSKDQLKQVDDLKDKKEELLGKDKTLQEKYDAYIKDMEASAEKEVTVEIWQLTENALPKELQPILVSNMYKYEILKEED